MLSKMFHYPKTFITKKPLLFIIALFLLNACFSQEIAKLEELMSAYSNQYKFNGKY